VSEQSFSSDEFAVPPISKIMRVKATRRRALKGVATIGRSANSGYFKKR